MADANPIFHRERLTAGQLRSVAEKRHGDALCLLASGDNARLAGAMYMAGFVVECLLKAAVLDRQPGLGKNVDPARLAAADREVYALLFSHDLASLLDLVPEIETKLRRTTGADGKPLWHRVRGVCAEWTIYARYSPKAARRADAEAFVGVITEAKPWLTHR